MRKKPLILIQSETNPILMDQIVNEIGPRFHEIVISYSNKALNRYNVRPGRIFGNPRGKERYRILENVGNTIVYKDLNNDKTSYEKVDELLEAWNLLGISEISPLDSILEKIKKWLTPFLGGVLVAALIAWLTKKVGR